MYDPSYDQSQNVTDPDELAAILRAKQMGDNAPPPPDPYGRPQTLPSPDAAAAPMATVADPMGGGKALPAAQAAAAGQVPANGAADPYGRPVTTDELRAALDAYSQAASQPAPKVPFGYGRKGLIFAGSNADYETKMGQRQAAIDAAKAKLQGLQGIEQVGAQAQERQSIGHWRDAEAEWYSRDRPSGQKAPDFKSQAYDAWRRNNPNGSPLDFEQAWTSANTKEPDKAPPAPSFIPVTTDSGPASFDARSGRYIGQDGKPITPGKANKLGNGNAPPGQGGKINPTLWKQATNDVRMSKIQSGGDPMAELDPNEIGARYQQLTGAAGGQGQNPPGQGGAQGSQYTHVSASGKYGWIPGTGWQPISKP